MWFNINVEDTKHAINMLNNNKMTQLMTWCVNRDIDDSRKRVLLGLQLCAAAQGGGGGGSTDL